MTANSKRRSFSEFARILAKEPGWGDADDVLQELLGGFLLGSLEVTWRRGDVPSRPDGVPLMIIRHEMAYGPDTGPNPSVRRVTVPVKTPPQEAVSRDEWLQAFRAFGEQDRRMGADWSLLADIPISEYPPVFRQAYIDRLYTTDAEVARWLGEQSKPVVPSLTRKSRSKGGSKPKYTVALQQFIDRLAAEFKEAGRPLTLSTLKSWLTENAVRDHGYDPTPMISDCDDIEFFEERLWWKDRNASQKSTSIKTVERYIRRAKNPNLNSAA